MGSPRSKISYRYDNIFHRTANKTGVPNWSRKIRIQNYSTKQMKELKHILKYYLQNENHEFLKVQYSVEFTIWIQWKNAIICNLMIFVFHKYFYMFFGDMYMYMYLMCDWI